MISKNIFSRFFSFLTMATLLVACSQNDDNAMTKTNSDNQANRLAPLNLPHGKLIIRNNTHHTFINDLSALNILRNDNLFYWLSQKIIINPYTNIELVKYSSTTTQGIDYNGNAEWIKVNMNAVSSIIDEDDADVNFMGTLNNIDYFVEWNSFEALSEDGTVKFKFKVDAQTGEITVNDPFGTFTTTAFVDGNGDIIIKLGE